MFLEKELNRFGKHVVKEARTVLTKKGINATKDLYNSLRYDVKVFKKNSWRLSFSMEEHGKYVDEGVKGVGGRKADGTQWKVKKTSGRFKYKNKKPPPRVFSKWLTIKGKGIRDARGRFIPRKSAMFAMSNIIYHQGIAQTEWFSRPFELAFERLPVEIVEAYGLDLESLLKTATK